MIEIAHLTKRFAEGAAAVDDLTFAIGEGEICVLIGPSGCGKTTTMRMINRLIEPDSGKVTIAGRDITDVDPVQLRRSVGYVIQQVGLFPHMTIAENIATVPQLLGWESSRIAGRVDELLARVDMAPSHYRNRYPRELSGGQKQRVGVARALAADPPVMLMDEPFGALDPITRESLQEEFLCLLDALRKTIVFVTHDIDEALKMGTRIAIMRAGRLVQYDRPERILAHPADPFVETFVGGDRALKRLALMPAVEHATRAAAAAPDAPRIAPNASLREALSALLATNGDEAVLDVRDGGGVVTLAAIRDALNRGAR